MENDTDAAPKADEVEPVEFEAEPDDAQKRLWLKTLTALLQLRSHESDPSGRVQFAFDQLHVAACERAVRILHSDLPE